MAAPANTVAPAVTGTASSGSTLSCSTGTWTGSPDGYRFQWRRNGGAILGATASSFVVRVADQGQSVSCEVTAFNDSGSVAVASNAVSITRPTSSAFAEADPVAEADLATHAALTTSAHGGLIASSALDTDGTLAANSDAKVASQKAVKTLVGTKATSAIIARPVLFPGINLFVAGFNAVAQGSYVSATTLTTGNLNGQIKTILASRVALTGLTPKFRLCGNIIINNTAPTSTFQASLNPVTAIAGGTNALSGTVGAAVLTCNAVAAPAAGSLTEFTSTAWTDLPADGGYVYVITISGSNMAAGSLAQVWAWVELSYV